MPHSRISTRTRSAAKRLRGNQTNAERAMWRLLRPFREGGVAFRRQSPVGPYVVDFVWLGGQLIIEVDGGQHGFNAKAKSDNARTSWLKSQGFQIMRFWNNEVLKEPEGCHTLIANEIESRRSKLVDRP
jgi:very-short-patch-repair endonuclease